MAPVGYQSLYQRPRVLSGLSGPAVDAWSNASKGGCYSAELHACINNLDLKSYPLCAKLMAAYDEDFDATDAKVVALPYCDPFYQKHYSLTQVLLLSAAVAAVTGLMSGVACAVWR